MSDESELATAIVAHEVDKTLRQLTNFGTNTTTSVNNTILTSCCAKAIRAFGARFCTYDSTNSLHVDCAMKLAMVELWLRTDLPEASERVRDIRSTVPSTMPAIALQGKRKLTAVSNSPYVENSPVASGTDPVFGEAFWEGYV